RVIIEQVRPAVDAGRFPIKRTIGESVTVVAGVFADGHDVVVALLRDRPHLEGAEGAEDAAGSWRETPMTLVGPGTDEWTAMFAVDTIGWHEYSIAAWVDRFRTWRRDLEIKAAAGQDVA